MSLTNPAAERALVGCLLADPTSAPRILARIQPDDLTTLPGLVLESIARLTAAGTKVEVVTVADDLRQAGHASTIANGAHLVTLMQDVPVAAMVDSYVEPILRMRTRRKLLETAQRMAQQAESDTIDHDLAILDGISALDQLAGSATAEVTPSLMVEDLVSVPDIEPDWIFPGVLETEDRLLITAGEGSGKSVLVRQFAVCAAAGVHPFTGQRVQPRRVLMIDCENSIRKTRRHMRRLVDHANSINCPLEGRLKLEIKPAGMDLTGGRDAAWLLERVTINQPELLTIGPLYRLYEGDPNDERTARKVSSSMDAARLRCGAALITETHAGHGQTWSKERDLRPKGSSLWRAWPESIRALRPVTAGDPTLMDVEMVGRGDREERQGWPDRLAHGGHDEWPWVARTSEEKAAANGPDFYKKVRSA